MTTAKHTGPSKGAMKFEEWVAESRRIKPSCGCIRYYKRMFLCSYHKGAQDAWEACCREAVADLLEAMWKLTCVIRERTIDDDNVEYVMGTYDPKISSALTAAEAAIERATGEGK